MHAEFGPRGGRERRIDVVWLFPSTYVVHLAEEYFVAGGFAAWVRRAFGVPLSDREFVAWNAFGLALMCVGARLVSRDPRLRFIELALAIAVLGNATAHVVGSLATWTYSPGLVTGVVVWGPLGWVRLWTVAGATSARARFAGASIGVLVIVITIVVLAWRNAAHSWWAPLIPE